VLARRSTIRDRRAARHRPHLASTQPISARNIHAEDCVTRHRAATAKITSTSSSALGLHPRLHLDQPHRGARCGDKAKIGEIWERSEFILGYVLTFVVVLLLAYGAAPEATARSAPGWARRTFFSRDLFHHDFFTIGVMSNSGNSGRKA